MDVIVTLQILHGLEKLWKPTGAKSQSSCEALHVQRPASTHRSISDYTTNFITNHIVPGQVETKSIRWSYDGAISIKIPIFRDLRRTGLHISNSVSKVLTEASASMVFDLVHQIIPQSINMEFLQP